MAEVISEDSACRNLPILNQSIMTPYKETVLSIRETVELSFKKRLNEYCLKERIDASRKAAIRHFVENCAADCARIADDAAKDLIEKASNIIREENEYERRRIRIEDDICELEQDVKRLQKACEELEKKKAELEQEFSDPKMREAYILWNKLTEGKHDSEFTKQRKITAAGAIISAALGMQTYFGKNVNNNEE